MKKVLLIWLQSHELGTDSTHPTFVAIMGTVFDVSGNTAYAPKNPYNGVCVDHSRTEHQMPMASRIGEDRSQLTFSFLD